MSLERVLNAETHSPYSAQLGGIKSVEAPETLIVRVMLDQPNAGIIHKLTASTRAGSSREKRWRRSGTEVSVAAGRHRPVRLREMDTRQRGPARGQPEIFEGAPKVEDWCFG